MTTASIDMRNSLHNIYAVNHKNEILNLKDLTTQPCPLSLVNLQIQKLALFCDTLLQANGNILNSLKT